MTRKNRKSDTGSAPILPDVVSIYAAPETFTLYAAPTTGGWGEDKWEYTRTGTELFHTLPSKDDVTKIKEDIKEDINEMKKILQDLVERIKKLEK